MDPGRVTCPHLGYQPGCYELDSSPRWSMFWRGAMHGTGSEPGVRPCPSSEPQAGQDCGLHLALDTGFNEKIRTRSRIELERPYHGGCWPTRALFLVHAVVLPALTNVCPENTSSSLSVQFSWPLLCKAFLYYYYYFKKFMDLFGCTGPSLLHLDFLLLR